VLAGLKGTAAASTEMSPSKVNDSIAQSRTVTLGSTNNIQCVPSMNNENDLTITQSGISSMKLGADLL